ncbi:hypothetical protein KC19_VG310800 [Ceratodon purpureus]|uniref:polyribonucleotide nucleotidyltransferase n=1 Tax=Ceratodon purpureus TaxID=3225 RepID=A0A8T0HWE1_CERPU|nr:hypothetical protein KC19_VG310800 [Ceratodon purpureus]
MWGVQGTLQAPHLSAATGLRLATAVSRRGLVERVQTRVGRVVATPGNGQILVVVAKDEGVRMSEAGNDMKVAFSKEKGKEAIECSPTLATTPSQLLHPVSVTIPIGNREIVVETGLIGRQANGAITITDGETVLLTTVCTSMEPSEPSDFVPLSVQYQERFSAAGRTSGGFIKREGRARDHEVLVCRLIDRPMRPMIARGFHYETQILVWVLSYDGLHSPDPLAITSAGAALAVSDVPMSKPVAGVRVGLLNGQFVVNPTVVEMERSTLDLVVAGTADAVLMIEGYCDFLTEEELVDAVEIGHGAIKSLCAGLQKLAEKVGKEKNVAAIRLPPATILDYIESLVGTELESVMQIGIKQERGAAMKKIEERVLVALTGEGVRKEQAAIAAAAQNKVSEEVAPGTWEDEEVFVADGLVDESEVHVTSVPRKPVTELFDPIDVKRVFKEACSNTLRRLIVKTGVRSDGRAVTDVRPIQSICGLLPRTHGSALFTRGETQALVVTTLGGDNMGQRIDNLTSTEDLKRFYLQYSFPPSSVGEVGRIGAPNRREIGHGTLAERALEPIIPDDDGFPYTIRVESSITESNGSSSMASVCGGCLAMLDAGVPLKASVAGIAMGLILNTKDCGGDGEPLILSDILGSEDALGDMDFKVAGNETGITAFQMDIKVEGITVSVMRKALEQARVGRLHILGEMSKSDPPPAYQVSIHAPQITMFKVDTDKISLVVGPGGKTIRGIIESSGVESVDVSSDDGSVRIVGRSVQGIEAARVKILGLTSVPTVGTVYRNCKVKTVTTFGCFVEIAPGKEGLCHISELTSAKKLARVEDFVNVGDSLDVKLIEINARGQLRLSHKACSEDHSMQAARSAPELAGVRKENP